MYSSGVYDDIKGCGSKIDTAVLIVGFGHDKFKNKDYWHIKNSIGTDWGDLGYMKLIQSERKTNDDFGPCGMFKYPLYVPVLTRGEMVKETPRERVNHLIHDILPNYEIPVEKPTEEALIEGTPYETSISM